MVLTSLLQDGAPIMYVSRQLGHKDASITLRVYAHSLPDASNDKLVDALDEAAPDTLSALNGMVSRVGNRAPKGEAVGRSLSA